MRASFCVFLLLLLAAPGRGVVIRHDVSDQAYRDLAKRPEFAAGNVVVRDLRGPWSGVVIGEQYVMTAGHSLEGYDTQQKGEGALPPHRMKAVVLGQEFEADYFYLCPAFHRSAGVPKEKLDKYPLGDVAIIHLTKSVAATVKPGALWTGGLIFQEMFTFVGQGKSGTGKDNDEPIKEGILRGFTNRIDYLDRKQNDLDFRSDFDDGSSAANTLNQTVYGEEPTPAQGSGSVPTPLEGTTAAGDSGGGVWIQRKGGWYIAGIASFRFYSCYGGQAGYTNLSAPAIAAWLRDLNKRLDLPFTISAS